MACAEMYQCSDVQFSSGCVSSKRVNIHYIMLCGCGRCGLEHWPVDRENSDLGLKIQRLQGTSL